MILQCNECTLVGITFHSLIKAERFSKFQIFTDKVKTEKNENFIWRLRWKTYHFCKCNSQPLNESTNGYFGFKTLTTPPPNEHLNGFENDLYDLIQKVEFTNVQNTFQQQPKKDVQSIKLSNNMLVFADKRPPWKVIAW